MSSLPSFPGLSAKIFAARTTSFRLRSSKDTCPGGALWSVRFRTLEIHPDQRFQPLSMGTFVCGSFLYSCASLTIHCVRSISFCDDDPVTDVPAVGGAGG